MDFSTKDFPLPAPAITHLKPQPGPQMSFLESVADWCVFGGAAGGG